MTREFDVIVYGATGFVGKRAVRYLAAHPDAPRLRWAIAGRDRTKLELLARELPGVAVVVAAADDEVALAALAARTRVVLALAGPFARYADALVAACVRAGTHYADITGETPWVKTLIDRHHAAASAAGTRIVPSCGFDSVPSDIGTYVLARFAQTELGADVVRVRAYFQIMGGINGGTLASLMGILGEPAAARQMQDPELLTPASQRTPASARAALRDPSFAEYDFNARSWVAPFVMGPINTRVVRRSAGLLASYGTPYATAFAYQEYMKAPLAAGGPLLATALATGSAVVQSALRVGVVRRAVEPLVPKPGTGPSDAAIENGWFRCELIGFTTGGVRVLATVAAAGDPGNAVTVTCAGESALALALDTARLPGGTSRGGVLTPATALGKVLVERLRARNVTLEAVRG